MERAVVGVLGRPGRQAAGGAVVHVVVDETLKRGRLGAVEKVDSVLTVVDARAWSEWLRDQARRAEGVWLVLAKKGTTDPTILTYEEALEEAICHGWVDGQLAKGDERTFRRRFTPRRSDSVWSKRNVAIATRLIEEGRMHRAGLVAVEQAKADGRWDRAYAGQATMEVPSDLAAALKATPPAKATFDRLSSVNRYSVLYRVTTAKRAETRQRRSEQFVAMLARGETIRPQRRSKREIGPVTL